MYYNSNRHYFSLLYFIHGIVFLSRVTYWQSSEAVVLEKELVEATEVVNIIGQGGESVVGQVQ